MYLNSYQKYLKHFFFVEFGKRCTKSMILRIYLFKILSRFKGLYYYSSLIKINLEIKSRHQITFDFKYILINFRENWKIDLWNFK